jgi:hypothetical protein
MEQAKNNKVVVVVFGGGPNSSDAPGDEPRQALTAGDKVEGLGERDLANYEAQSIAQQIKNDFPGAKVILSGPNGINSISSELVQDKPEHVLIYGYSMGANSAVGLTNVLTNQGIRVDQLTTVDPPSLRHRGVISDPEIKRPELVGSALNYIGALGKQVDGAENIPITPDMRERTSTPMTHRSMEDITAPFVVGRIESRLSQVLNKSRGR